MYVDTVIEICSPEYLQWAGKGGNIGKSSWSTAVRPAEVIHWIFIAQSHDKSFLGIRYSWLSLNEHLYKTDTSVKQTHTVGPCLSLLPLFDSL